MTMTCIATVIWSKRLFCKLERQGYPVEKCVAQILRGLDWGRVEFCVGGIEKFAATASRLWPALYRQLIRRVKVS
ncbi:hypothetical protein [Chitinimonas sp. BJB300]|uniref:hypothetical protein n=1 Tax=Chitinimonas sp. BJB300 TaxID=1559339 RepID=UPI0011122BB2|nr:hypothetical protein [Chitinimonas sp. BJB300]TSJ87522.1 hypothetical protein FG002_013380 [Chitinimonas sp. BJB300]